MQAQTTRLNALGQRLTKLGKLDDGEFDFSEAPAVGGPETAAELNGFVDTDFESFVAEMEESMARKGEQLRLLETLLIDRDMDASLQPKGMPVRAGYVSSHYGKRPDPFTGRADWHPGVDFNGPRGTEILAVASGVVTWSGNRPGYGRTVEIDHGNGYMTRYAHNSENLVEVGKRVKAGQVIAKMGSSGRSTGSHVHLEVWLDGKPLNPAEYVKAMR